jgi:hypothetical protein
MENVPKFGSVGTAPRGYRTGRITVFEKMRPLELQNTTFGSQDCVRCTKALYEFDRPKQGGQMLYTSP